MKRAISLILYGSLLSAFFAFAAGVEQDKLASDSARHVAEYERYRLIVGVGYAAEVDWAWLLACECGTFVDGVFYDPDQYAVERLHSEYSEVANAR
jgi:hypothetical protein